MTLARTLVRQIAALQQQTLPPPVASAARLHLLDAIGVGLAASTAAVGAPYRRFAAAPGDASVFGRAQPATPADAALVNGGLIHSLEYDDTHTGSIVHGSAVVAAAALAAGEAAGASGAALLSAYVLGWEVLVRIGLAAPGAFQGRGFQVTSVGGALVAALIGAALDELDEDASVNALGIALSQASGVFEFLSNGSSVKSLHPGWAAHGGLLAARLAAGGMTGPETALEGRFGLFASFAGDATAAARFGGLLADLGTRWHLMDAAFKFYPCCHYIHPFVEAVTQLRARGVQAEDVRRLVCLVPAGAAPIICEPWAQRQDPPTSHAARWSLPIVVAAALIDGSVGLETFERPISPAVRALVARIDWEVLEGADFPRTFPAEIVCALEGGGREIARVDDVYGNSGRPAAPAEVAAKFRANARRALAADAVEALASALDGLDGAASLGTLSAALRVTERNGGAGR